jgi:hypothetical protein
MPHRSIFTLFSNLKLNTFQFTRTTSVRFLNSDPLNTGQWGQNPIDQRTIFTFFSVFSNIDSEF